MSLLDALRDILIRPPPVRLKCKPGDLARVVQPGRNQDRFVTVLRADPQRIGWWQVESMQRMYCYRTRCDWPAGHSGVVPDRALQPVRDRPGEDESLRWVPKPVPVEDFGIVRPRQSVWPA